MRDFLLHNQTLDGLALPCCRATSETVFPLLLYTLVGHLHVAKHLSVSGRDDARVDIGSRAKVIENTGRNGMLDEGESFVTLQGPQ